MPNDALGAIDTIFIVMMENRSFDHILGYRGLVPGSSVEGLRADPAWMDQIASIYDGNRYAPFVLTDPFNPIPADPPHGRSHIATQLAPRANGTFGMDGFVTSYAGAKGAGPIEAGDQPPVMGYFTAAQAPVFDFFADQFAVCDHWHAALPAGTQPNRLMAMGGQTLIDNNRFPLPHQPLVYDWLTERGVSWRVYHAGLPFFALMVERLPEILAGDHFRPFAEFFDDVQNEPPDTFPQVVFLEPVYSDAPHIGANSDDHAPGGIKEGQAFLLEAYRSLTRVPDLWKQSMMIVTYDEHGGFFDHVPPPNLTTQPPPGAFFSEPFDTLGVRVPALVISPFVTPGSVYHGLLDHTSILRLLGEKFGNGSYSEAVDARATESVSAALDNPSGKRDAPIIPSLDPYLAQATAATGRVPGTRSSSAMEQDFQAALDQIRHHPQRPAGAYDDLLTTFPPGS